MVFAYPFDRRLAYKITPLSKVKVLGFRKLCESTVFTNGEVFW
jgi:hypothetical protein